MSELAVQSMAQRPYSYLNMAFVSSYMAAYDLILSNIYYIACESLIFRILTSEKTQLALTSPAVAKTRRCRQNHIRSLHFTCPIPPLRHGIVPRCVDR
jgi:hypothetical protein